MGGWVRKRSKLVRGAVRTTKGFAADDEEKEEETALGHTHEVTESNTVPNRSQEELSVVGKLLPSVLDHLLVVVVVVVVVVVIC